MGHRNFVKTHFLICTFIFVSLKLSSISCYSSDYAINELTANGTGFIGQVASWTASSLCNSSIKYYNCSGGFIMGGYGILGPSLKSTAGQYFRKVFTGLPSHNVVYFSYTLFILDSVDATDYFDFQLDSTVFSSWKQWYRTWGVRIMVCGNTGYPDLTYIRVFGRTAHSAPNITASFIMRNDEDSTNESYGFRDVSLSFAITSSTAGLTTAMCGSPPGSATLSSKQCTCGQGYYYDDSLGSCQVCDSSCSSCYGSSNQECYWCATGYFNNGTLCLPCDSSCVLCHGTDADQCDACASGKVLYNNEYCMDSSYCVSPLSITTDYDGNSLCNSGCNSSQYLLWDGSCTSSCDYPLEIAVIGSYYQMCTYSCSTSQYLYWNGACSDSCNLPLTTVVKNNRNFCIYPCSLGQYLYWNQTCSSSCQLPLVSRTKAEKLYCDFPCSNSSLYLYWNGSCLSDCSSPLAPRQTGSNYFCDYSCTSSQYLYPNGSCASTCDTPMVASNISGNLFCRYPCNSDQYLNWDGICLDSCDYPKVAQYAYGKKFCNRPCSSTEFLVLGDNKTNYCTSSCGYPLLIINQEYGNTCSSPCATATQYFVFSEEQCEDDCPSPYLITDESLCKGCKKTTNFTIFTLVRTLQYAKYLDIDFPSTLQTFSANQPRNILSVRFGGIMPESAQRHIIKHTLPSAFRKYNIHSSFLVNIWPDLMILVASILIAILSLFLQEIARVFDWSTAKITFEQLRILFAWNFVISLFATGMDYVVLFGILELKNVDFKSAGAKASFAVCLIMITAVFLIVTTTYNFVSGINRENEKEIKEEISKPWRTIQVLYLGYRQESASTRMFYLVYTIRLAFPSIIAGSLYSHPLAQTILYTIGSIGFILFIIKKKPIVNRLNHIQLLVVESLVLMVNFCLLILAAISIKGDSQSDLCNIIGDFIILGNSSIHIITIVFLVFKLVIEAVRLRNFKREQFFAPKAAWLQFVVILLQQGGMGFEEFLEDRMLISSSVSPVKTKSMTLKALKPASHPKESRIPNYETKKQPISSLHENHMDELVITNPHIKYATSTKSKIEISLQNETLQRQRMIERRRKMKSTAAISPTLSNLSGGASPTYGGSVTSIDFAVNPNVTKDQKSRLI